LVSRNEPSTCHNWWYASITAALPVTAGSRLVPYALEPGQLPGPVDEGLVEFLRGAVVVRNRVRASGAFPAATFYALAI
jgi:hypothetical protein